jgi:hypothetical protein
VSSQEDNRVFEKKIDTILEAIQNFGLNFIQKIGELKHNIGVLTDQMEKMNKALISVKGLEPKISEISSMKKEILGELHYLQSQIKTSSYKNSDIIKMKSEDESLEYINLLKKFKAKININSKISELTSDLEEIKKNIYEITGGHRVLFDMGETIKAFNEKINLSESDLNHLEEKITFWINKLK